MGVIVLASGLRGAPQKPVRIGYDGQEQNGVDRFLTRSLLRMAANEPCRRLAPAMTAELELVGFTSAQISPAANMWAATDELAREPSDIWVVR